MATYVAPADVDAWEDALLKPVSIQPGWRDAILSRFTCDAPAEAHLQAYRHALGAK